MSSSKVLDSVVIVQSVSTAYNICQGFGYEAPYFFKLL